MPAEKKVIVLGDSAVGKTEYVKSLLGLEFTPTHTPSVGVQVHQIKRRRINFAIWDIASGSRSGIFDGAIIRADYAIIVCDTNQDFYSKYVKNMICEIKEKCGNIPICIVYSKCEDEPENKLYRDFGVPTFRHSSKNKLYVFDAIDYFNSI